MRENKSSTSRCFNNYDKGIGRHLITPIIQLHLKRNKIQKSILINYEEHILKKKISGRTHDIKLRLTFPDIIIQYSIMYV